jgi:hypothetical protein
MDEKERRLRSKMEVLSTSPVVRKFLAERGIHTVRDFVWASEDNWRVIWPTGRASFCKVRHKIYKWGLSFGVKYEPAPEDPLRRAELMAMATAFAVSPEYESLYDAADKAFRLHKIMEEKFFEEERVKHANSSHPQA